MTGSTLPSPHILGKHINFGKKMPNTDNNKAPSISSGGNYQSKQLKKQEWKVDGGVQWTYWCRFEKPDSKVELGAVRSTHLFALTHLQTF